MMCVFNGRYDQAGALLASGAKDTDVVIWDVIAEAGQYRLRGHKDAVTDVAWLDGRGLLFSASKVQCSCSAL